MPTIDLTKYVYDKFGVWTDPANPNYSSDNLFGFTQADTFSPQRLMLRWADDKVILTGPLSIRVTVQAENLTTILARVPWGGNVSAISVGTVGAISDALGLRTANGLSLQASTIYDYILNIAAGQVWSYALSEQISAARRDCQLGNNLGVRVVIEPAFVVPRCTPASTSTDLTCDYAVADRPDLSNFFPVACEPCQGNVIGLPPTDTVTLAIPPATGGCTRTRFFNGMFITREDLETEQRYERLKAKLQNRAAGSGVAWGFNVAKQGDSVCVMPGYGVDCCGNDLTLTTVYKVPIAALLADPAAASALRANMQNDKTPMHLLLEYIECPQDPRPVHGDPCAPEASRCEMSRIRESVRLRLVPPKDCCDTQKNPVTQFVDEVQEIEKTNPLNSLSAPVDSSVALDLSVPFILKMILTDASNQQNTSTGVQLLSGVTQSFEGSVNLLTSLSVEVDHANGWTFVPGAVSTQIQNPTSGPGSVQVSSGSDPSNITFIRTFTPAEANNNKFIFNIPWQAQSATQADSGTLTVTVSTSTPNQPISTPSKVDVVTTLSAQPSRMPVPPCDEPCPSATESIYPPTDRLKTLLLAGIGYYLTQKLATDPSDNNIALSIYRYAWVLLFGLSKTAPSADLASTIKRLFGDWCDELSWKGPQCCGDPHGVVIGCAIVSGGTIQRVDPFAGRRYVVHYPLLQHWGQQFGISPPDAEIARFFSKLCCVAGLPAITGDSQVTQEAVLVDVRVGYIAFGDPTDIQTKLQGFRGPAGIIISQQSATLLQIIEQIVVLGHVTHPPTLRGYKAFVLDAFVFPQTVMFLSPMYISQ
jgi:hypothetical protein